MCLSDSPYRKILCVLLSSDAGLELLVFDGKRNHVLAFRLMY